MKNLKGIFTLLIVFLVLLTTCKNTFIHDILPDKVDRGEYSAIITGDYRIGETLTVTVENAKLALGYQWTADGTNINNATNHEYIISGADAGKLISCIVTHGNDSIPITGSEKVPYNIVINTTGKAANDNVVASPDHGHIDTNITLSGTLANTATNNMVSFNLLSSNIDAVTTAGSINKTYAVKAADASNGVITINVTFIHSNSLEAGLNLGFTINNGIENVPVSFTEEDELLLGASENLTITVSGTYSHYIWFVNDKLINQGDEMNSLELKGINYTEGKHQVLVIVYKDMAETPYSQKIYFTITD